MSISLELKHLSDSLEALLYDDLHKTLYATDASVYRILPTVALQKQIRILLHWCVLLKNIKFSHSKNCRYLIAGQTVGNGIVVDVSKYFTKIVAFDPIKNSDSSARSDS
jgi:hypothetical protein